MIESIVQNFVVLPPVSFDSAVFLDFEMNNLVLDTCSDCLPASQSLFFSCTKDNRFFLHHQVKLIAFTTSTDELIMHRKTEYKTDLSSVSTTLVSTC